MESVFLRPASPHVIGVMLFHLTYRLAARLPLLEKRPLVIWYSSRGHARDLLRQRQRPAHEWLARLGSGLGRPSLFLRSLPSSRPWAAIEWWVRAREEAAARRSSEASSTRSSRRRPDGLIAPEVDMGRRAHRRHAISKSCCSRGTGCRLLVRCRPRIYATLGLRVWKCPSAGAAYGLHRKPDKHPPIL